MEHTVKKKVKVVMSARVIRKDGSIEDLGVISESHSSNALVTKLKKLFGGK